MCICEGVGSLDKMTREGFAMKDMFDLGLKEVRESKSCGCLREKCPGQREGIIVRSVFQRFQCLGYWRPL